MQGQRTGDKHPYLVFFYPINKKKVLRPDYCDELFVPIDFEIMS